MSGDENGGRHLSGKGQPLVQLKAGQSRKVNIENQAVGARQLVALEGRFCGIENDG